LVSSTQINLDFAKSERNFLLTSKNHALDLLCRTRMSLRGFLVARVRSSENEKIASRPNNKNASRENIKIASGI